MRIPGNFQVTKRSRCASLSSSHALAAAIIVLSIAIPNSLTQLFPLIFCESGSFNINKMSKSSHNSRKKKRSSSSVRLATLKETIIRLIEALSRGEVSASRSSSSYISAPFSTSSTSYKHHTLSRGPSKAIKAPSIRRRSILDSFDEDSLAAPARQEKPKDLHTIGVYAFTGSAFTECRREVDSLSD